MSSLLVVQQHDSFTFAVDTARCFGDSNKLYRINDEVIDKVHRVGNDIVFLSGLDNPTTEVSKQIHSFVQNGFIDEEKFQVYLQDTFPLNKCQFRHLGINDLGVQILRIKNNQAIYISLTQDCNFKLAVTTANKTSVKVSASGFDAEKIYTYAMQIFNNTYHVKGYLNPDNFIKIYQNNYSAAVGGNIRVYRFNKNGCKLIKDEALIEPDLDFVYKIDDGRFCTSFTGLLQAATGTFHGVLEAGEVKSTNISGSTITGGTIQGTNIIGSTLTSFGYVNDTIPQKTVIENGSILTNALKIRPMNGNTNDFADDNAGLISLNDSQISIYKALNNVGFSADKDGNVRCTTINGGTPVTSLNISSLVKDNMPTLSTSNININSGDTSGQVRFANGNAVGWDYASRTFATKSSVSDLESRVSALERK